MTLTGRYLLAAVLAISLAMPAFGSSWTDWRARLAAAAGTVVENEHVTGTVNLVKDVYGWYSGGAGQGGDSGTGGTDTSDSPGSGGGGTSAAAAAPNSPPEYSDFAEMKIAPDIFFPFKRKESETMRVEKELESLAPGTEVDTMGNLVMTSCEWTEYFYEHDGQIWYRGPMERPPSELGEQLTYLNEAGVCTERVGEVFIVGNLCYVEITAKVPQRRYEYETGKYKITNIIKDYKMFCPEEHKANLETNLKPSYYRRKNDEEEEDTQHIVLVIYDCPVPDNFPATEEEILVWNDGPSRIDKVRTLTVKSDGTKEYMKRIRNAGCRAISSFAVTMYRDEPLPYTTQIEYNCPDGQDGYERRIEHPDGRVEYKRLWRKDWGEMKCLVEIAKTQVGQNGLMETINASHFEDDDNIDIYVEKSDQPPSKYFVYNTFHAFMASQKQLTVSEKNPEVRTRPSFVRRYFGPGQE